MQLQIQSPKKALNKAYLKAKTGRAEIELFKRNFQMMLLRINEGESEEHGKNIVSDFLKSTWYEGRFEINTKGKTDLVIHAGKTAQDAVGVILEVKRPSNKAEMMTAGKPNAKALQELLLYYLRERIDGGNKFIRHLIVTNIYEWFVFDERWAEQHVWGNAQLRKDYEEFKRSGKPTHFFYEQIAKPFIERLETPVPCTHFDIREYEKIVSNAELADDNKLIALYKILSPAHLLKERFANDSNSLDKTFYEELLHIIGLEEVKDGSKRLIQRKQVRDEASLLENTIAKIEERDSLERIPNVSSYGEDKAEQALNVALELCITWVNRILFMKLLEAQLSKYHQNAGDYLFLTADKIHDYDEMSNLFFGVLAERPGTRKERLAKKFPMVPYLNSSLFERTELEWNAGEIALLDNQLMLPLSAHTVLKEEGGKRLAGKLPTLAYLFRFLDAYDFASEGAEEIQEENKNLINASVLGLIFEKINGYKDGSFFTPGAITMYMCRETIQRAVVHAFNRHLKNEKALPAIAPGTFKSLDDVYNAIGVAIDKSTANRIINAITICDPAVGSGHFLVSALNEMVAIKSELRILTDKEGRLLRDVEITVENDELIVLDDGRLFQYNPKSSESRRIQETLFNEKQTLIENCLFGVDLNPNSVKICRLRLWIELLKSAYYTAESGYTELETLPNIDINIKQGNSLVSRFPIEADLAPALKSIKWDIKAYRGFVNDYKNAKSKDEKRGLVTLINSIKSDFRTEIGLNDPKRKRLNKIGGEYEKLMNQKEIFGLTKAETKSRKTTREKLEKEINKLSGEIDAIKDNKVFEGAFEWRFEFPEVLDTDGRFGGFDVLLGNPPYVQIQKLAAREKEALERGDYKTYARMGDLYQLFYELGNRLLKAGGHLCYITSNKWMRADYGRGTRDFFATQVKTEMVVDFGMAQLFSSATTYTNILLMQKIPAGGPILMCRIKDDYDATVLLGDYVAFAGVEVENPGAESWIAYDKREYGLIRKIESAGKPLKDWDIQINYGLKTGFNEAFIIDTETRDRLVAEDSKSAEIIRPILRGEDVKAYAPQWAGLWLILTHNGLKEDEAPRVNAKENFPAVYNWLAQHEDKLQKRYDKGDHWSNLRNCAYLKQFFMPKIIYPNMTKYMPFVYDKHQFFTNDKAFIITGENLEYLTCFFNSALFKFAFKDYFPELLGETRELRKVFFDTIPVKEPEDATRWQQSIDSIVTKKQQGLSTLELEKQIDNWIFEAYELTEEERAVIRESVGISVPSLESMSIISERESA